MTDFRALCAELAALDGHCVVDCTEEWADAMYRLRAALAQPEPQGPQGPVMRRLLDAPIDNRGYVDLRERSQPEPQGPTDEELEATARAAELLSMKKQGGLTSPTPDGIHAQLQEQRLAGLRAVAARWGRTAIEPVPVAERLPGPEDCLGRPWEATDAGFCWWLFPVSEEWRFLPGPVWRGSWQCSAPDGASHWLPHHALPVPQQEADRG